MANDDNRTHCLYLEMKQIGPKHKIQLFRIQRNLQINKLDICLHQYFRVNEEDREDIAVFIPALFAADTGQKVHEKPNIFGGISKNLVRVCGRSLGKRRCTGYILIF